MCKRPSRSENSTVTALTPFWSVNHLTRSSWSLSTDTRFLRCSLAFKLSSSSSSYDNSRKLRYSMDISSPVIVEIDFTHLQLTTQRQQAGCCAPLQPVLSNFIRPSPFSSTNHRVGFQRIPTRY